MPTVYSELYAIPTANEGESIEVIASFFDEDDQPATPNTISYRIISPITLDIIRADTDIPAANEVTINVKDGDTAITDDTRHKQKRRVIVTAEFSGGDKTVETFDYFVRNIKTMP